MVYAVDSLKNKLEGFISSQFTSLIPISELRFVYTHICYWQSFIEEFGRVFSSSRYCVLRSKRVEYLKREMERLADSFKDIAEIDMSRLASLVESGSFELYETMTWWFFQEVERLKQEIISITKDLIAEVELDKLEQEKPSSSSSAVNPVSSRYDFGETIKRVGLDDELEKLKSQVFTGLGDRKVISFFGMAGIGKTTLANEVYHDPIALELFEVRLFLTFGPQYDLIQLFQLALAQLGDEMGGETDFESLGWHLYRWLSGKRYLIVLDDIWNGHVWFQIKYFFPRNTNGSRIITTTRLIRIGFEYEVQHFQIRFLNDDESWDLLRKMVFTSEDKSCSPELEKIGRKIAQNCEGLPAVIIEVGKILRKSEKMIESWTEIAEKEDPLTIGVDDNTAISKAVCFSYEILPQHLKLCFLYMGLFPKKYEICPSMLINLWMSEGFLEFSRYETPNKVAKKCLSDLVLRSLALVSKESSSGGIKTCRIHFVYRNLCISEARKEAFFHIVKRYADILLQSAYSRFWGVCFHNNIVLGFKQVHKSLESAFSGVKSLHCFGPYQQYPMQVYLSFESLKVLYALTIRFYMFPREVLELVELRFLAITYDGEIPWSISQICNLEVLIVRRHHQIIKFSSDNAIIVYWPIEIWKMRKLRHLQCMGLDLPGLSINNTFYGSVVLENLRTLLGVSARSLTRGVHERLPKLRRLGIQIEPSLEAVDKIFDFSYLDRLKSIKCIVENPCLGSQGFVSFIPTFSVNIRKITLSGCGFSWCDIACIGRLPMLRVLKLRLNAFRGSEWETNENEFNHLVFLLLEDLDIEQWGAKDTRFPMLRKLIIRHCYKLREIPFEIGYGIGFKMIEVDDCSPSFMLSVQEMHEQLNHLSSFEPPEIRIKSSYG